MATARIRHFHHIVVIVMHDASKHLPVYEILTSFSDKRREVHRITSRNDGILMVLICLSIGIGPF